MATPSTPAGAVPPPTTAPETTAPETTLPAPAVARPYGGESLIGNALGVVSVSPLYS